MCEQGRKSPGGCHCRRGLLRGFVQPQLLLKLAKQPAHGYELMEMLGQMGELASTDPGNLYRILRGLEDDGVVRSNWDTSGAGPARRVYELTENGLDYLKNWVVNLRDTRNRVDDFIKDYEIYFNREDPDNDVA
jgi:poly-beta-hydroxybutyrate-responsive repressor